MKQAVPKLRYIGYVGNGESSFQCLVCHFQVYMNANAERLMEWCAYCGERWKLGHVSDNRRLERRHEWMQKMPEFEPQLPAWVIEERNMYSQDWDADLRHDVYHRSAHDIWDQLKRRREQAAFCVPDYKFEYRVRLASVVMAEEEAELSGVVKSVINGSL